MGNSFFSCTRSWNNKDEAMNAQVKSKKDKMKKKQDSSASSVTNMHSRNSTSEPQREGSISVDTLQTGKSFTRDGSKGNATSSLFLSKDNDHELKDAITQQNAQMQEIREEQSPDNSGQSSFAEDNIFARRKDVDKVKELMFQNLNEETVTMNALILEESQGNATPDQPLLFKQSSSSRLMNENNISTSSALMLKGIISTPRMTKKESEGSQQLIDSQLSASQPSGSQRQSLDVDDSLEHNFFKNLGSNKAQTNVNHQVKKQIMIDNLNDEGLADSGQRHYHQSEKNPNNEPDAELPIYQQKPPIPPKVTANNQAPSKQQQNVQQRFSPQSPKNYVSQQAHMKFYTSVNTSKFTNDQSANTSQFSGELTDLMSLSKVSINAKEQEQKDLQIMLADSRGKGQYQESAILSGIKTMTKFELKQGSFGNETVQRKEASSIAYSKVIKEGHSFNADIQVPQQTIQEALASQQRLSVANKNHLVVSQISGQTNSSKNQTVNTTLSVNQLVSGSVPALLTLQNSSTYEQK